MAQMVTPMATSRIMISRSTFSKCPSSSTPCTKSAVLPKNVWLPVADTVASISPRVTVLPILASPPANMVTGRLSPVSAAWSTWMGLPARSTQSAGMAPPAPRHTMSPTTKLTASMEYTLPSRFTMASGLRLSRSAAMASPALSSSTKPTSTFSSCSITSTPTSIQLSVESCRYASRDSIAMAIQIIMGIGCTNSKKSFHHRLCTFSRNLLGPNSSSRRSASCSVRPSSGVFISVSFSTPM
mmetsp:Transcript_11180/g.27218  ORF Transcript_11180/g.27218 Transcript_11180/m.27218 type:complete len:241 (+) Transcript_11180:1016-1738(+)